MLYEDNYLAHYGIKEQRWGIRRFQNKDGSLTEEGRKRYRDFHKAEDGVRKKMSNKVLPYKEKPMDIGKVMERGKISESEAHQCAIIANRLFKRASEAEPEITEDVVSAVRKSGSTMYDLDNRLKQPTSIAAKIGSDAKDDGVFFKEAASGIKDLIRYTSISNESDFTKNYNKVKLLLEQNGYIEGRCKNYFTLYRDGLSRHKAVQCVFIDPNGMRFELQFHTPASEAAKELKIPIYNARRQAGLSKQQQEQLESQMTELAEQVKNPKNVFTIKAH